MGMFDKFPYRNTRDLNLNWIIKKILELEGLVGAAVSDIAQFLSKKGGKMEGSIDMQGNRIFNVPTPAGDTDVASRKYVDDKAGNYLPLAGGTMTGAVNMGGNKITSVATPEADADAATKKYVDEHSGGVSGDYLPLAGGTMTGSINMNGQHISGLNDPSEDTQAARKGYVDAAKAEANAYTDTKADLPKTVSGTVISLDDASDATLQGLHIYGKTTQDGTPTAEAPVEPVSVGSGGRIAVRIGTSQEDTSPQTLNISTPNGLPGIPVKSGGNYTDENGQRWICDEVDLESGVYVQRVVMKEFDGTENFGGITLLGDVARAQFQVLSNALNGTYFGGGLYSHGSYKADYFDNTSHAYVDKGTIWLFLNVQTTVLSDIQNYLKGQYENGTPVSVLYRLITPIETRIPDDEVAAYASMHTNKPNTTIYNDAMAHMVVGYYTPNATMLQSDISKVMGEKLSKTGGTMTGSIAMGGNKITSLATPEADTDAATKKYVDDHSGGGVSGDYLPLAGGTMSGAVNMGGNNITSVADPTAETDAATKKYVDENSGSVKEITYGQVTLYGFRCAVDQCLFRIYLPFSATKENVNFENFSPYGLKVIDFDGKKISLTITKSTVRVQSNMGNIVDVILNHDINSNLANKMNLYAKAELESGFTVRKI